jgi:hypothetical protein
MAEGFDLGVIDFRRLPEEVDLVEIRPQGIFQRPQKIEELVLRQLNICLGQLDLFVALAGQQDLLVQFHGGFVIDTDREELSELVGIQRMADAESWVGPETGLDDEGLVGFYIVPLRQELQVTVEEHLLRFGQLQSQGILVRLGGDGKAAQRKSRQQSREQSQPSYSHT